MPAAHKSWTVLPHGPFEKLNPHLWRVEGDVPHMKIKRVMTVARFADGRLLIHSAVAMDESSMSELEAWGEPSVLVVPNGWHRLDAAVFKKRYPRIRVVCPAGSRKKVEQVVEVDATYAEVEGDEHVRLEHVPGTNDAEGVLRVKSEDGVTLVFNDLIFNLPHGSGLAGLVFRLMGSTGGPRITRVGKLFIVKDKNRCRDYLAKLARDEDLTRIIVSHGAPITEDPGKVLQSIASRL